MKVAPIMGLGQEKSEGHVQKSLLQKFNMPVDHLSYDYVENCVDGRQLERILKILRSGEEGDYPNLIAFTERQLTKVRPDSKLLRIQEVALEPGALEPEQWNEIKSDIQTWTAGVTQMDRDLAVAKRAATLSDVAAPVRSAVGKVSQVSKVGRVSQESTMIDYEEDIDDPQPSCSRTVKTRKPQRRRPTDWNAYNADQALTEMLLDEERRAEMGGQRRGAAHNLQPVPRYGDVSKVAQGMHPAERRSAAQARRQAGNECFNAGDAAQAAQHYAASLALHETSAAYTNRALVYLRQGQFRDCAADCTSALRLDPACVKALYRRACARGEMGAVGEALEDARAVLRLEPGSAPARQLERRLAGRDEAQARAKRPGGGRRMQISEVIEEDTPPRPKIVELSSEAAGDSSPLHSGSSAKPCEVGAGGDAVGIGESAEESGGTELPGDKAELPKDKAELAVDKDELLEDKAGLPGDMAELPKDEAELSREKAELPKDKAELPFDMAELPVDMAELPKDEAELPVDMAELPVDMAELPKDEAELPVDMAELPVDMAELPRDKAELPKDKAELPKDKAELPVDMAELPVDMAELPKDKAELPKDKAELLKDKADLPKDKARLSGDKAELPLGKAGVDGSAAIEREGSDGGFRQTVVKERRAVDPLPDTLQHEGMFFLHAWSTLHQQEDMLQHAKLLNSIKPKDLRKAIGPALDQKMLSLLLACLDRQAYLFSPDMRLAYLANIVGLQRFGVAACFMGSQDFAVLENICKLLFEQGTPVPAEVIAAFNQ